MPIIPENYVHTRSTPFWDSCSIPEKLSGRYTTKPSVYGRICVMQGAEYRPRFFCYAAGHFRRDMGG